MSAPGPDDPAKPFWEHDRLGPQIRATFREFDRMGEAIVRQEYPTYGPARQGQAQTWLNGLSRIKADAAAVARDEELGIQRRAADAAERSADAAATSAAEARRARRIAMAAMIAAVIAAVAALVQVAEPWRPSAPPGAQAGRRAAGTSLQTQNAPGQGPRALRSKPD